MLAIGVLAALGGGLPATVGPVAAATDRPPDLRMAPLRDFRIETTSDGHRRLRFTAIMLNLGQGHFEVRGNRSSTSDPTMSVRQVLYNSAGGSRLINTSAEMRYAGDGHDHWHVQRMMSYALWPASGSSPFLRGAKVGYCFLDTTAWDLDLPGARQFSYYKEAWCGTQNSTSNRVGISLGWGDSYPHHFAFQWIDITGLAAGEYYVRSIVDESNFFTETTNANNCTWARVSIPASGTSVTLVSSGASCIAPPATTVFPGMLSFIPDRRIAFAAGTHTGYKFAADGTILASLPATLPRASGADALRSATIPGHSGSWFYIHNGIWAGYWVRASAVVVGAPLPNDFDGFPGTPLIDPESRVDLAVGWHSGFRFTVDGTAFLSKWYPLAWDSGANVDRRGQIPGHPGTWLHVTNGIWADFWLKESDRVVFNPP